MAMSSSHEGPPHLVNDEVSTRVNDKPRSKLLSKENSLSETMKSFENKTKAEGTKQDLLHDNHKANQLSLHHPRVLISKKDDSLHPERLAPKLRQSSPNFRQNEVGETVKQHSSRLVTVPLQKLWHSATSSAQWIVQSPQRYLGSHKSASWSETTARKTPLHTAAQDKATRPHHNRLPNVLAVLPQVGRIMTPVTDSLFFFLRKEPHPSSKRRHVGLAREPALPRSSPLWHLDLGIATVPPETNPWFGIWRHSILEFSSFLLSQGMERLGGALILLFWLNPRHFVSGLFRHVWVVWNGIASKFQVPFRLSNFLRWLQHWIQKEMKSITDGAGRNKYFYAVGVVIAILKAQQRGGRRRLKRESVQPKNRRFGGAIQTFIPHVPTWPYKRPPHVEDDNDD